MPYALDTDETLVIRTPPSGTQLRRQLFPEPDEDRQVYPDCSPAPEVSKTGLIHISPDAQLGEDDDSPARGKVGMIQSGFGQGVDIFFNHFLFYGEHAT